MTAKRRGRIGALVLVALLAFAVTSPASAAPVTFDVYSPDIGVSALDVVQTGFSFLSMFDTWTVVILGIILAPVLVGFMIWLFRKLPRLGG